MITFKYLHGLAPSYLADVCTPVSSVVGRWQLRSVNSGALVVTRIRTTIGRRDFAVDGPATWNSLPVDLRTSSLSRDTFAKKNLKLIYLAASALEVFSNWALYKLACSFIHSTACQKPTFCHTIHRKRKKDELVDLSVWAVSSGPTTSLCRANFGAFVIWFVDGGRKHRLAPPSLPFSRKPIKLLVDNGC